MSVGLEDVALNRARWRMEVGEIAVRVGEIRPTPFMRINPDQNWTMIMMINQKTKGCLTYLVHGQGSLI